jgi:hypothetical protein
MALNDHLLSVIRVLQIILLVVIIYGAIQGAMFIKDTRTIMTEKLQSGDFFSDIAKTMIEEKMQERPANIGLQQ